MPGKLDRFNARDGARLEELRKGLVPLKDTALGVAAKQNVNAVINNLQHIDHDERQRLLDAIFKMDPPDQPQRKPEGKPKDDNNYL